MLQLATLSARTASEAPDLLITPGCRAAPWLSSTRHRSRFGPAWRSPLQFPISTIGKPRRAYRRRLHDRRGAPANLRAWCRQLAFRSSGSPYGTLAAIEGTPRDFPCGRTGSLTPWALSMPSSRRTDEILKSQVSFRGDMDGIEVKVTETMGVEVDVTVAPLDRRLLGPSGPATASSSATILSSNASTTKEPGNGLPQSPQNRLAPRSRAQSGYVPGHSRPLSAHVGPSPRPALWGLGLRNKQPGASRTREG